MQIRDKRTEDTHVAEIFCNLNTSEIAAECITMCGITDIANAVATRKDKLIKRYLSNSNVVCEICSLIVKYNFYS